MKKVKYLIIITVIFIIVMIGIEFLKKDENIDLQPNQITNTNNTNNTTNTVIKEDNKEQEEITSKELLEKADKTLEATGWAGASNNVIILKDNTIYYYNKATEECRKVATEIEDIYYNEDNPEEIIAKQKKNSQIFGEDIEYLKYEK